ncbi:type II toxin-antitoxin system HicA family toxin [Candidatus Micrarchaeota archaeon]|nr:type II toxin-antitoxin system HicA family toxin [Candidatus Micrarchaeota archaeon]
MKLVPVAPSKLAKVLGHVGYFPVRKKGSHVIFEHAETGRITVVPFHSTKKVGVGLLSLILREIGLSRENYFELLKKS